MCSKLIAENKRRRNLAGWFSATSDDQRSARSVTVSKLVSVGLRSFRGSDLPAAMLKAQG